MSNSSRVTRNPGEIDQSWWRLAASEAGLLLKLPPTAPDPDVHPTSSPAERLWDALQIHLAAEADSLVTFERLLEESQDPLVALLLGLILGDEARHHDLLQRMSASLRNSLFWTKSPAALPTRSDVPPPVAAKLIAATRARIREEHESVRQWREAARQQGELGDGLFGLLLDVIARDSEKHERILRFLLQRLEAGDRR